MKINYLKEKVILSFILYLSVFQYAEIQGQCNFLGASVTQVSCDDQGTQDPLDDLITLDIVALSWNNDPSATFEVYNFTENVIYGPFSYDIGGTVTVTYLTDLQLFFVDVQDNFCYEDMSFPLAPCFIMNNPCVSPLDTFVLVGDAIPQPDTCFQLTRPINHLSGGIWYQNELDLYNDFGLSFDLNFGDTDGADGMVFILQPLGNNISGNGGYLGFENLNESIGIEFDTYQNNGGQLDALDPSQDHMSFQKNGSLVHNSIGYLDSSVPRITFPNIENGDDHTVLIQWDATDMILTCTFQGITFSVSQDIVNTIFNGKNEVFWGWLSATGAHNNRHTVCVNDIAVVDALSMTVQTTDITCSNTGAIDITISGGVPPYNYQWSNSSNTEDISNLTSSGIYTVNVTDNCGNIFIQDIDILDEDDCCEIIASITQINCNDMGTPDESDDLITLQVNATNAGGGPSGMFRVVNVLNILGTFNYGSGGTVVVPFATSISLTFIDEDDSACVDIVTINLNPCSPPCIIDSLNYVTQGDASQLIPSNCYQLTADDRWQSGQVWGQNTLNLNNSFTKNFTLNFGNEDNLGADGIMFILQPLGNIPIGSGGSFGFLDFPVSAGFEFDTFQNGAASGAYNDPPEDHVGFLTNGSLLHPTDATGNLLNTFLFNNNIEDGLPHQITISWNPVTMLFSCTFDGTNTLSISTDLLTLFGGDPNVFWGWSGSTGSRFNDQLICINDQFCECAIAGTATQIDCNGMDTAIESDDLITIQVNASGINAGPSGAFTVVDNYSLSQGTFSYNLGGTMTIPYSTNTSLSFFDFDDPNCSELIPISLSSCSPSCVVDTISYITQGDAASIRPSNCYRLTPEASWQSGQVWSQSSLNLTNGFSIDFSLYFGTRDTLGADGIMFILQPLGNIPIGSGGSFGFSDFPVSVGFEFDTFENDINGQFNDPDEDHLGFLTNGSLLHDTDAVGNLLNTVLLNNIEDGLPHQVNVTWDPITMLFSCTFDGINTLNMTIDLITHFGGNPNVYWGWSGATGARINSQSVCILSQSCPCAIDGIITQVGCDDMGTIDNTDDMVTLQVDAYAINAGPTGSFTVIDNSSMSNLGTFMYNDGGIITIPYSPNISYIFSDADDPNCSEIENVKLQTCSSLCTDIRISISLDNNGYQTSWDLKNDIGFTVASSNGNLAQYPDFDIVEWDLCLEEACYYFTIYDSQGDGICCDQFGGGGSYIISNLNTGSIYGEGDQFGYAETVSFCLPDNSDDCPENLTLPGDNVISDSGIYKASKKISANGLIIEDNLILSAGESVELLSGFEVMIGQVFVAEIGGCDDQNQ